MTDFRDCLVLFNPYSTGYTHARHQVDVIKALFAPGQFHQHELAPKDLASGKKLLSLLEGLNQDSLLVIGAGDGTINAIVNLLYDKRLPEQCRHATILPLWGGNASDLAHMLNGHRHINVRKIVQNGRRTPLYPLEVSINTDEPRLALAYASVGAVAHTAMTLDASPLVSSTGLRRVLRFPLEVVVGLSGLTRSPQFLAELNGAQQRIYDVLCINGPRIAKIYRSPAKIHQPGFIGTVMKHKHPTLFAHPFMLISAWLKRPLKQDLSLKVLGPTYMQLDGEVSEVSADTTISIKQSSQPIYVLATKL